ncbi:hypothetical protein [Streptomyces sp. NPDC016675]|uniref:hypothetical protein n=1 Tax=Streptomyces sp. NPDC016675 TaxID=3364970 RepID=UPI0036F9E6FB
MKLDPHFPHRPGLVSAGAERVEVVIGTIDPLDGTNRVRFRVGQAHPERPTGDGPEDHAGGGVSPGRSTCHDFLSPHGAGR